MNRKRWMMLAGVITAIGALFIPPLYVRHVIAGASRELDRMRRIFDE